MKLDSKHFQVSNEGQQLLVLLPLSLMATMPVRVRITRSKFENARIGYLQESEVLRTNS